MRKKKKLTGPEWIKLKEAVESWEKEDMAFHSTDYLKELSQKVEAGPPTYSPRTPKQNEYYQAYSYVKEWINRWERFQAFDDLKGRGTWHKNQFKHWNIKELTKTDLQNPGLHKYQIAHFIPGERYQNDIEYLVYTRSGKNEHHLTFIYKIIENDLNLSIPGNIHKRKPYTHTKENGVKVPGYSTDLNTFCQLCGGVLSSYDTIRSERVCPECGLVTQSFSPEEIRYNAYHGPYDSDNLGRNTTYGDEYDPFDWRKPRRSSSRPNYEGRYYLDKLRDSLDTKNKLPFGPNNSRYNKELEIRVKMAGYGSSSYKWWDLKRRRPPRKKENETPKETMERQTAERDKKRLQRVNKWFLFLRGYCNENELPRWVYDETMFILKKMPVKFSMNSLHSRLGYEKIIIGLVLYVIKRTFPKHPLISNEQGLTSAEFEIIRKNLARHYREDSMPLYDKRAMY